MQKLIITIDGPAGSGKTTVAQRLAERLGVEFLDTGTMYRAVTAHCLDRQIVPADNPDAVAAAARAITMRFDWATDPPHLHVNGEDITHRLRDADVTGSVSDVAAMGPVREVLVQQQRRIGGEHPRLVSEGRDQGSIVFTDADVKFYLDAIPDERARRRTLQLREAGREADEKETLENLLSRDHKDSNRKDGPLTCPDGAIVVDTSEMTLEQVVDHLEALVRQHAGDKLGSGVGS